MIVGRIYPLYSIGEMYLYLNVMYNYVIVSYSYIGGVEIKMVLPDKTVEDNLEYSDNLEEDIEENVYSKKARMRLLEDGELSNEEEAFMEGYDWGVDINEKWKQT